MKFKKILIIAIAIILLTATLILIPRSENSQSEIILASAECKVDTDCTKVQTSCCVCSSGGTEQCVAQKNKTFFEEKLNCEANSLCIALYACEIESCKCIENKCEAIKISPQ